MIIFLQNLLIFNVFKVQNLREHLTISTRIYGSQNVAVPMTAYKKCHI